MKDGTKDTYTAYNTSLEYKLLDRLGGQREVKHGYRGQAKARQDRPSVTISQVNTSQRKRRYLCSISHTFGSGTCHAPRTKATTSGTPPFYRAKKARKGREGVSATYVVGVATERRTSLLSTRSRVATVNTRAISCFHHVQSKRTGGVVGGTLNGTGQSGVCLLWSG